MNLGWRSLLPGGLAQGLKARGNEGGEDEDQSGDEEGGAEAVGEVDGASHDVGSGESAEGSHGVDEGDASGSGGAAKKEGWEGPERSDGSPDAGGGEKERGHREDGVGGGGARNEGESRGYETGEEMPLALSGAVGAARDEDHGSDAHRIGDGGDRDDALVGGMGEAFDEDGQPETEGVEGYRHREVNRREQPDSGASESAGKVRGRLWLRVGVHLGDEPLALGGGEPVGVSRAIGKDVEGDDAEDDRGQSFAKEEPLPSGETG